MTGTSASEAGAHAGDVEGKEREYQHDQRGNRRRRPGVPSRRSCAIVEGARPGPTEVDEGACVRDPGGPVGGRRVRAAAAVPATGEHVPEPSGGDVRLQLIERGRRIGARETA